MRIAIRSDVHARIGLAKRQAALASDDDLFIDLGDVETHQIEPDHPLREGQKSDESTIDAIIRNAKLDSKSEAVRETNNQVFLDFRLMQDHLSQYDFRYRAIMGNSEEVWTKYFSAVAPEMLPTLESFYANFYCYRNAAVEFIAGKDIETVLFYLPWKASMDSVRASVDSIGKIDVKTIIIFSHDYLTSASIDRNIVQNLRSNENEEQVLHVLDNISSDAKITGYFGHIGMKYPAFEKTFDHRGKRIHAYHADEKDGKLLHLEI